MLGEGGEGRRGGGGANDDVSGPGVKRRNQQVLSDQTLIDGNRGKVLKGE